MQGRAERRAERSSDLSFVWRGTDGGPPRLQDRARRRDAAALGLFDGSPVYGVRVTFSGMAAGAICTDRELGWKPALFAVSVYGPS